MTTTLNAEEIAYFQALFSRRGQAAVVELGVCLFRDGTSPRRHDCHANAARMASEAAEFIPVHGWLIESGDDQHVRLAAHSLVKNHADRLIEITPLDPFVLPFLQHEGPPETFFALLPRFKQITWPSPSLSPAGVAAFDWGASASL